MAADTPGVRRGEDLFGRNVRVAGNAIFCGRSAALPFVSVGKANRQIGTPSAKMKRTKSLPVQPFGSLAKPGVVIFPCCDSTVLVDPRCCKYGIGELSHGDILAVVGKDLLRPGCAGIGDDVPVN